MLPKIEYSRNCPNCNKTLTYKRKQEYLYSIADGRSGLCISCARKGKASGEKNPMFGVKHTEETKRKIREKRVSQVITDETRRKISEAHRGKIISEETRKKMSDAQKGRSFSSETITKMRQSAINTYMKKQAGSFILDTIKTQYLS